MAEPAPELDLCGHNCGHAAAIETAMKPLTAAIAGITPPKCEHPGTATHEEGGDIAGMGTYGRMTATPAPTDSEEVNAALALVAAEDAAECEEGEI
jgi:hypothetical protein